MEAMEVARAARRASVRLKAVDGQLRSEALGLVKEEVLAARAEILAANERDLHAAGGLAESMRARLDLQSKWGAMVQGIADVQALEDPVGRVTLARQLDKGLDLYRVSCPVGVLLVVFEARPEVLVNITALALKSGNAAILKGGKELQNTFVALQQAISRALARSHIPPGAIQLVGSRGEVSALLQQDKYIDVVIPRGSNALVRSVKENTKIPVLGHADGLCAVYLHADADMKMAQKILLDAKMGYPAACNAVETLLVHEDLTEAFSDLASTLVQHGIELRCDERLLVGPTVTAARPEDYDTEFLNLTLAIKRVASLEEAVEHINEHGSHHTDCIVTQDERVADAFMAGVDSAGVYWNCSTRFADGHRYGFGAEVGISTNKIHARGPVGLEGMMIYQYRLKGHGNTVGEYGSGKKSFVYKDIVL